MSLFFSCASRPGLQCLLQASLFRLDLGVVFALPQAQSFQLLPQPGAVRFDGVPQRQLLLPVAFHGAPQRGQILHMGRRRGFFRFQRRLSGFQPGHLVRQFLRGRRRFRLAAFQRLQRRLGLGQLLAVNLNFGLLGRQALSVRAAALLEGRFLPPGGGFRVGDGL